MTHLAGASLDVLRQVIEDGLYLDHPHIFQYLTLLGYQYDPVRAQVEQGAWQLRHSRFTIIYLSEFVRTTTINPVMAVETERLTKEEHERQMNEQNVLRRRESVTLLGKIGLDYIAHRGDYDLNAPDKDEFIREHLTHTLEEAAEDEAVADLVAPALKDLREADAKQPAASVSSARRAGGKRGGPVPPWPFSYSSSYSYSLCPSPCLQRPSLRLKSTDRATAEQE